MNRTRFQYTLVSVAVALAMVACAPAPAQPTTPAQPTQPPTPTDTPQPTETPNVVETPTAEPTATAEAPAARVIVYQIDPNASEASFTLNEELFNVPTVVVGVTSKVTGSISVDWRNPANTSISKLEIDAADFKTDNENRNRAIRRFILQTDQYPKIEFEPTSIEGLPASVTPGITLSFKVTGNLKIRNISKPATFDVTATADEARITGEASTVITRDAYELSIPSVPGVANVTNEVTLTLKFVATAQ
jgi:polyisoprenoid-binding protein YceI